MDGLTVITCALHQRVNDMADRYEREIDKLKRRITELEAKNNRNGNGFHNQVSDGLLHSILFVIISHV